MNMTSTNVEYDADELFQRSLFCHLRFAMHAFFTSFVTLTDLCMTRGHVPHQSQKQIGGLDAQTNTNQMCKVIVRQGDFKLISMVILRASTLIRPAAQLLKQCFLMRLVVNF